MRILEEYQMLEIVENINQKNIASILSKKLKHFRLDMYEKYKALDKDIDNPYSTENISSLLSISRRHYQRLENPKCVSKNISMDKLLILSRIYGISLDEFFKDE